jgi:hypothetical protein
MTMRCSSSSIVTRRSSQHEVDDALDERTAEP